MARPKSGVWEYRYVVRLDLARPGWVQGSRTIGRLGEAIRDAPDIDRLLGVQRGDGATGPSVALSTFAPEPASAVITAVLACSRAFDVLEIEPAPIASLGLQRGAERERRLVMTDDLGWTG
jgi:hypothetical protein